MAINLNSADNGLFNRDEKNVDVPRSPFAMTYTTAFTMNEGEIIPCYRELLTPNSNIEKSETYVMYQSPLATRNFSNQRVYTHTFTMPIKHMWHEWREFQFGGRYQDNVTPHLHFHGSNINVDLKQKLFFSALKSCYFPRGSLGDKLGGIQTDTNLETNLTPNPWLFFLYLTIYKYYFLNQPLLRGDSKWRRIWFPSNEEKWSFEVGEHNRNNGVISRFWSPEHRSGVFVDCPSGLSYNATTGVLSFPFTMQDDATGLYYNPSTGFTSTTAVLLPTFSVTLPYFGSSYSDSELCRLNHAYITRQFLDYISNLDIPVCLLDLFEIRYRNFRNDYYVSGLPSPLLVPSANGQGATGQAGKPHISASEVVSTVDVSDITDVVTNPTSEAFGLYGVGSGHMVDLDMEGVAGSNLGGYNARLIYPNNYTHSPEAVRIAPASSSGSSIWSHSHTVPASSLRGSLSKLKLNTSLSLQIDMDNLRLLSATTMYLEALTRSDGDYASNVRAIYGVTPSEFDLKPRFLGGTSSNVYSMDVVQTAPQGSQQDTILGSVTQRGQAGHRSGDFKYFTKDSCVVLSLMSIVPDSVYCQGMDRKFTSRSPLDIPNPLFMGLGMDAILNYELFVSHDNTVDFQPFAYTGAWNFYRFRRNEVHDLMIPVYDSNNTLLNKPFSQMNQIRYFSERPTLSESFVSTKGNISHEHLAVTDTNLTPEYAVIVSNTATVVQPMTKYAKGQGL